MGGSGAMGGGGSLGGAGSLGGSGSGAMGGGGGKGGAGREGQKLPSFNSGFPQQQLPGISALYHPQASYG